jgi:hypothetical protein
VVLASLIFWCPGCKRSAKIPTRPPDRLVRAAPTWGPDTEGLQCRLRPTKRLWTAGETVTFKLDIRNQGKRLFAFDASQPVRAERVSLDGRWCRQPRPETAAAKVQPLAPGAELADLMLALPRTPRLPLTPGYHAVAVAFMFEGIEVVSNSITIEIAPPPPAP